MTLVLDAQLGQSTSANPTRITCSAAVPVGELVVIVGGYNNGSTGADPFTGYTDSRGNTYLKAQSSSPPGPAAGLWIGIWYSWVTYALTTADTIAQNGGVVVGKGFGAYSFKGGNVGKSPFGGAGLANQASGSHTLSTSLPVAPGDLVVGTALGVTSDSANNAGWASATVVPNPSGTAQAIQFLTATSPGAVSFTASASSSGALNAYAIVAFPGSRSSGPTMIM